MSAATSPPGRAPIKVLLVDDEGLVRSGFKVLLDMEDDITVVGEATNGVEAVDQARATRPDVVLMDIRMPKVDGIQATSRIVKTPGLERVRVLILTTYDTDAYVFEACTPSGWWPPETRCSRRGSPGASSLSSPPTAPPPRTGRTDLRC
jgi:CheY-like chemotaxis protein